MNELLSKRKVIEELNLLISTADSIKDVDGAEQIKDGIQWAINIIEKMRPEQGILTTEQIKAIKSIINIQ